MDIKTIIEEGRKIEKELFAILAINDVKHLGVDDPNMRDKLQLGMQNGYYTNEQIDEKQRLFEDGLHRLISENYPNELITYLSQEQGKIVGLENPSIELTYGHHNDGLFKSVCFPVLTKDGQIATIEFSYRDDGDGMQLEYPRTFQQATEFSLFPSLFDYIRVSARNVPEALVKLTQELKNINYSEDLPLHVRVLNSCVDGTQYKVTVGGIQYTSNGVAYRISDGNTMMR